MYRVSPSFNFDLAHAKQQEVPDDIVEFVFIWQDRTNQFFFPPATTPSIEELLTVAPFLQPLQPISAKTRNRRSAFSEYQLEVLELQFVRNRSPRQPDQYLLAILLDLSEDRVRVWFTNRRAKQKKLDAKINAAQSVSQQQTPEYSPSYAGSSPASSFDGQFSHPTAPMVRPNGQPNFQARPVCSPQILSPNGQSNYPERHVNYPQIVSPDFPARSPNYLQMVSPSAMSDFPVRPVNYPRMVSPGAQSDFPVRPVSYPQMIRPGAQSYMQRPVSQNWQCTSPNYYPNFPVASLSPTFAPNVGFYQNCANSNFKPA